MTNWERIKKEACNTIGYSEAADKESFRIGASVGFGKAEDMYQEKISRLEKQLINWEAAYHRVYKDIQTVSKIINEYSPDNS